MAREGNERRTTAALWHATKVRRAWWHQWLEAIVDRQNKAHGLETSRCLPCRGQRRATIPARRGANCVRSWDWAGRRYLQRCSRRAATTTRSLDQEVKDREWPVALLWRRGSWTASRRCRVASSRSICRWCNRVREHDEHSSIMDYPAHPAIKCHRLEGNEIV